MNSPELHRRVTSDEGHAARLAASNGTPEQLVEEIYLLVYSRYPDSEKRTIGAGLFIENGSSRRQATEDLMWALINTPEFIMKD